MFYNTGIATYVWVLTNRKPDHRKGHVQLIDATQWYTPLRRNLGQKNCELSSGDVQKICNTFMDFEETEQSKIFPNETFGYWKVTVDRPLRVEGVDPEKIHSAKESRELKADGTKSESAPAVIKKVHGRNVVASPLNGLCEATIKGNPAVVEYEPDPDLRDTEQIPLLHEGGIEAFLAREVPALLAGRLVLTGAGEDRVRDQLHSPLLQAEAHEDAGGDKGGHLGLGAGNRRPAGGDSGEMRNTKAGLKPYPAYKELEIPWLEKVPTHWTVAEAKNFYEIQMGKMLQPQPAKPTDVEVPYLKAMNVQWYSVQTDNAQTMWASPEEIEQLQVIPGDLLVCEGGEGGRAGIVQAIPNGFIIQNALHRVRPKRTGRNELLQHLMKVISETGWFDAINNKATIAHFTKEKFANLPIPLPPHDEQVAIVRYLDDADQRIRAYVSAKERLIALLEEERQAIIHQTVTRGLDPNVKLKPSGVEWLGDVPEHWETSRVGHFSEVGNGSTPSRGNAGYWDDGVHPWLNSSSVNQGIITKADQFVTDLALRECHLPRVRPGSVLVGITGQGRTRGMSAVLDIDATINQHMAFITPKTTRVSTYFLQMCLTAAYSELRAISSASGNTKAALTCEDIKHFTIVLPPRDEQERLLKQIRCELARVDTAISRANRQIKLLEEYRTRLIADVVTGKLDVREAKP